MFWSGSQGFAVHRSARRSNVRLGGVWYGSLVAAASVQSRHVVVRQSAHGSAMLVSVRRGGVRSVSAVRASSDPALLGSACARFVTVRCGWAVVSCRGIVTRGVVRRGCPGSARQRWVRLCGAVPGGAWPSRTGWSRLVTVASGLVRQSWFGSVPLVLVGHARARRGSSRQSRLGPSRFVNAVHGNARLGGAVRAPLGLARSVSARQSVMAPLGLFRQCEVTRGSQGTASRG